MFLWVASGIAAVVLLTIKEGGLKRLALLSKQNLMRSGFQELADMSIILDHDLKTALELESMGEQCAQEIKMDQVTRTESVGNFIFACLGCALLGPVSWLSILLD